MKFAENVNNTLHCMNTSQLVNVNKTRNKYVN